MIQRIQTIYLLLAFACTLVSGFLQSALWGGNLATIKVSSPENYVAYAAWMIAAYAFILLSACLALVAIILFKNRGRQLLISSFSQFFIVVSAAFFLKDVVTGCAEWIDYAGSIATLLLAFIFVALAKRGIKRDEELVRAADRIR